MGLIDEPEMLEMAQIIDPYSKRIINQPVNIK